MKNHTEKEISKAAKSFIGFGHSTKKYRLLQAAFMAGAQFIQDNSNGGLLSDEALFKKTFSALVEVRLKNLPSGNTTLSLPLGDIKTELFNNFGTTYTVEEIKRRIYNIYEILPTGRWDGRNYDLPANFLTPTQP